MTLPPDADPLAAQPEPTQLDEEHVLEPVDDLDPDGATARDPVVVDTTGRMWRLRYRPAWLRWIAAASRLVRSVLA